MNNYQSQMVKCLVSVRCIDQQDNSLEKSKLIQEFQVQLNEDMSLADVARIISQKVSELIRGTYKVEELRIKGFTFKPTEDETFRDYVRVDPGNHDVQNIEAYCICAEQQKGSQFQNIEDETLAEVVPRDKAPGYIAKMKPGMLILADCSNCDKRVIKKVKLFKGRTGTFDLKRGIVCPQCRCHLNDLLSPCMSKCDYNYKGERGNGIPVNKLEWKSVPEEHILYWKQDEEYNLQVQQIVDWTELKIYIRLFDKRYCAACQQKIEGDDDEEIEERCDRGKCGHRYHPSCFKQVSQGGKGNCAAEGCKLILVEALVEE